MPGTSGSVIVRWSAGGENIHYSSKRASDLYIRKDQETYYGRLQSPFLITIKLERNWRRRWTELLLLPAERSRADHLRVVRAVDGKQLVQQVGDLPGYQVTK